LGEGAMSTPPWVRYQGDTPADATPPWEKYGSAATPSDENSFQREADNLTKIEPFNSRPGFIGHLKTAAGNFGGGVLSPVSLAAHPIQSGKSALNTIAQGLHVPEPFSDTSSMGESLIQSARDNPTGTAENLAGSLVSGKLAGDIGTPALRNIGEGAQSGAEGIINRTVGATKPDFARGANPGEGYFQGRLGPSMSMGSIADKAEAARDAAGARIGSAIDSGTGAGIRIDPLKAARAVGGPINRAFDVMNGPGGTSTGPLEDLSATFRPAFQKAAKGAPPPGAFGPSAAGFTPRDLFDLKRNVAQNTSWGDPTQIGLKSVRQGITRGVSGLLSDEIPELRPLNSAYQNLSKLADRASYRADTGIAPLTRMGRRMAEGALGEGLAIESGHPLLAAAPLVLDSVPVRTTFASGLHAGGRLLPAGEIPLRVAAPAAAISRIPNKKPDEEENEQQ
jgi:hypothetical protein